MNTFIKKFNQRVDMQNNPYICIGIQANSLFKIFTFILHVQNKDETENEQTEIITKTMSTQC